MHPSRRVIGLLVWLAFVCYLAVLCMFAISVDYRPPDGEEAPKVTDWMQGWGSIAGVAAGLAAAVAAAWLVLHEREQARLSREQARLAEAAQVEQQKARRAEQVTWYLRERRPSETGLRTPVDGGEYTHPPRPDEVTEAILVVVNSSDNCIYRVWVSIRDFHELIEDHRYLAKRGLGTIAPGQTEIAMPMRGYRTPGSAGTRNLGDVEDNRLVDYVQFKDPAGNTWRRSSQGELIEISDSGESSEYPKYSY